MHSFKPNLTPYLFCFLVLTIGICACGADNLNVSLKRRKTVWSNVEWRSRDVSLWKCL